MSDYNAKSVTYIDALPQAPEGPQYIRECLEWHRKALADMNDESVKPREDHDDNYSIGYYEDMSPFLRKMNDIDSLGLAKYMDEVVRPGRELLNVRHKVTEEANTILTDRMSKINDEKEMYGHIVLTIKNELVRREREAAFVLSNYPPLVGFFAMKKEGQQVQVIAPSGTIVRLSNSLSLEIPSTHRGWYQERVCKEILHTDEWTYASHDKEGVFMAGLMWGFVPDLGYVGIRYPGSGRQRSFKISELKPYVRY